MATPNSLTNLDDEYSFLKPYLEEEENKQKEEELSEEYSFLAPYMEKPKVAEPVAPEEEITEEYEFLRPYMEQPAPVRAPSLIRAEAPTLESLGVTLPQPPPPEEGILRQAADLPVQFAIGVNNSVKALTDLFGADNEVSQNLNQNVDWYRSLLSASSKQDEKEIGRILQDAEGKGMLGQLAAGLEAFTVAPADFVASGLGSLATFAATGLAGRAAAAARIAQTGVTGAKALATTERVVRGAQVATGMGMGAGIVKGQIYESVKEEMLAQGKTEEQARQVALEAQSYDGKNLPSILLGAGLGALDAFTGAEKVIGKILTKGGIAPDASRIGNIIQNGLTEGAPEFIQAAQEKLASNIALRNEGVEVGLTDGVFAQGALEGLVGVGMGLGAGAIEPRTQPATKEEVVAAAAETQSVARQSSNIAPETASLVEGQAEKVIQGTETPDQRVARLQAEATAAAGIELEEEGVGVEPTVPVTPPVEPTPEGAAAPVEPVVTPEVAEPPVIETKAENPVVETEQKSQEQTNTVKVFRGVAEAGNIPSGGAFFTDSEKDASAYAQLAALRKAVDENEQLSEIVGEIMTEEGAESITDLSISTVKNIIEGNKIEVGNISEGAVLRGNINLGNTLNLESFGSEVGNLPETWNEMNELGLVPETWESLDEDAQTELQDKYRNKAFYSLLEGEVNLNEQFNKGIDTIVFTDQNTEGKGTHRTYLTKAAEQFTQEAAPAAEAVTPNLEPLRRVARAEQAPEDVPSLVDAGLVEVYKDQPVLTEAGIAQLPEAERPRLNPEARKIQIDTGSNEVVAEAIAKNLRIGVDQVGTGVRMPAGWTLVEDIYVPPAPQEVAPEAATFAKGEMVRVTNRVPTYEGGRVVGGRDELVAGSVTRIMPDGKVEVRLQRGGYQTLAPNEVQKIERPAPEVRESRREPAPLTQQDREYLDAVERGDLDAGSKAVEQAAKEAGYTQRWFHGTAAKAFNVFRDFGRKFIYFTQTRGDAMDWAKNNVEYARPEYAQGETPTPRVVEAFINADNIFNRTNEEHINRVVDLMSKSDDRSVKNQTPQQLKESLLEENYEWYEEVAYKFIQQAGFDGAYIFESQDFDPYNLEEADLGILNPNLIKSAEPVTRDDQGKVIPLSQRFQPTEEDIRYKRIEMPRPAGMETEAVTTKLESLGFGRGGIVSVVNEPDASFEGRTIIRDGKVVGIELNAAALKDDAAVERVLNHEIAESANADGALNRLVEGLTPKERKEINDAITRLGYAEKARTAEEAARAVELLAEGWRGRRWFERAVARVEAWANKLGYRLTRRAAEYIAARNVSEINAEFKKAYNKFINVQGEVEDVRYARRDYQADSDSYGINDLSKIRKLLNISNIENGIVKFLSRDLLDAKWAKIPVANDATTHGHCYVAAEAAYHVLGGKGKDWEHRTLNNKGWPEGLDAGETHHFIQNKKTGEVIDPTRSQFGNVSIPYGNSIFGGAFMGKTAENPSIRAKALLHRIAAGEPKAEIRESRREDAIPTFSEGSPEASTLSNMKESMAKVDAASEGKPNPENKPTYKISEIASIWMDQGGDTRQLQDMVTEYTNLTPANAKKVADAIAKQYDKQQQIAEAVLETEAGVTLEGLPEGMEIPKDVDPKNKRTVLQRVIDATTGVRVKPVILQVPEKTALKEQIRLKAQETREAKKAQQETADAVVEAIKALELRGPMRAKQAQALAKRAAKVIWTSERSMENFMAYAERVMANTNYDADLREAKAAQKRAKELSKRDSIAAPQRETLEAIGNIGINLLNDPREFADVVNHYLRSFKPVVSEAYVVVPDKEMKSYLSAAEDEVVSAKAEFDVEDNEKLAEKYGVSVNDLQRFLDAEDIIDALASYAKREVIEGILNEKSAGVKEALKGVDTTILRADQRRLIDSMKVIDVKSLDSAEKQAYIRIGNNIIFNNNQTNGAEFFVATAKGQQSARDLAKNTGAMTKNRAWANILPALGSRKAKKLLKSWASELQSIADTFRNAFGKEAMTVFYEAMGMVDLDLGFTQAARTLEEIQEKMAKFYDKLDKKYKGAARAQDGILSEGIVAYLIQNVPAKGEADSLAQRRGLMQQNVAELRKSGDEDKIQMADRIQQLIQKLDGDTVDQILANLKREYPANYESLMWLKDDLFPQYKDFLKFSDENFNDQANNYNTPNYLPIVYSNASPALDLLQGKKKYYDNLSSSPKQSSYTIKRSDYTQLPMGSDGRTPKEIGLNLRKNAYNSLSDQITRAYTNPARQRISSFLKTPEAEEALGGKANLDFFADRIERLMGSRERRGSINEGFFGKAVDVIANLVRDIGTRISLAGSYQLIRQPADQVTVAVGATGRADLMAEHLAPRSIKNARPVIDLFSIGRRGDASSGYKYINQMEGAQSRLERYYTEGNWVKAKEAATRFADKFMTPLKVSDFTVAAATWMTFYRAHLAKNGIKFTTWEDAANLIKSDDVGHKRAAAYAENMTDIYQGSSDPTKMAVFAQKGKTGTENLLKSILVPFNSFGIQFRARVSSDITEIFTKSGDWKGKAIAVKDLSATIGGTVMFGLAKRFVLPAITYGGIKILYGIFGVDVEEPDEEKQKEEFDQKWRQLQGDIISTMVVGGFGQMIEGHTIDGMNYIKYMIDTVNESESVLDDDGEIMSFNKYSKERAPFYRYRSFDNAPSLGMLDIGMDQAGKAVLNTKMVLTPEEMERFTPEEQRFLLVALISDWLYLGGFNDADFARMWDKGRRDMINARKEEEKALNKIRSGR